MEARVGNLIFTSKFDSGNLAKVEKVTRDDDDEPVNTNVNYFIGAEPKPDSEYNVWTKPDCAGTPAENGNRSWFYFGIRGWTPNRLIKINIMNMNRQGKLYSQGHMPFSRILPGQPKWQRIRDKPSYETVDGQFILSFTYRFPDIKGGTCYFAFCFPWSYTESQEQMAELDKKFAHCVNLTPDSPPHSIYYHRELLCYSLDKLRIDLLTITSCHGMTNYREPRFDKHLFLDQDVPRCRKFRGKRVFLLTSRVHPGETPASYVYNGFLEFILRTNDPRAAQLRRQFVFKLIPMLNPDGVMRGHYRTDQRGMNLNRMYLDPSPQLHPSIYASKSLLVYHHVENRVPRETGELQQIHVNFPHAPGEGQPKLTERKGSGDAGRNSSSEGNSTTRTHDTGASLGLLQAASLPSDSCDTPVAEAQGQIPPTTESDSGAVTSVMVKRSEAAQSHSPWLGMANSSQFTRSEVVREAVKVEPLNLADLDVSDGSVSDSGRVPETFPTSKLQATSSSSSLFSLPDNKNEAGDGAEVRPVDSDLRLKLSELNMSEDLNPNSAMTDMCLDSDREQTERLGNEGSEDEDDPPSMEGLSGNCAPHLADPKLKEILPHESGIAFYVDLHGHASKRGCFIYGNCFDNEDIQVENMLYPKLISVNTAHFDFSACNFSERNMYLKDKRDGLSKEGSGRVASYKAIGITHSYTLECNYNMGRIVNPVPPAHGDDGRATPPPLAGFPPKYTQAHFEDVGRAVATAALDVTETNPWSRLTLSEHCSVHGVRDWVRRYLRSLRGGPRMPRNASLRSMNRNGNNGQLGRRDSQGNSGPPGGRRDSQSNNAQPGGRRDSLSNNGQLGRRDMPGNSRAGAQDNNMRTGLNRQNSQNNTGAGKRELGPVREAGMRANNSMSNLRNQRRSNTSGPSLNTSNSAPKLGSVAGNAPQAVQRVINERVPLVMTTAVVADTRSTRHLSADGSLRLQEEDKVQQLRNVNLLAISKRGGPPSRIPLPTNHSHLGLMGPLSTNADSGPSQKYLKGNLRHTRSGPAGFSSMGREKSKLAFLEPGGSASLSKTLPTASLQSMLQQQTLQTSPVPSSIHSISTPTLQLAGTAQTFGCGSSCSQVGPSTQLLVGPQLPAPPPPVAKASCGGAEGDSQSADNQSDSNSKRRRRYSNVKRRGVAPSPKQGASGKGQGQGQGQNKAGGAYDSDAERNKPRRRKQRRTHRRAAETVDGTTPAVEGEGPMEDGGVGQGRVHVRHHKSHRSHGSTSHGQSTMTSARVSPPKSYRSDGNSSREFSSQTDSKTHHQYTSPSRLSHFASTNSNNFDSQMDYVPFAYQLQEVPNSPPQSQTDPEETATQPESCRHHIFWLEY